MPLIESIRTAPFRSGQRRATFEQTDNATHNRAQVRLFGSVHDYWSARVAPLATSDAISDDIDIVRTSHPLVFLFFSEQPRGYRWNSITALTSRFSSGEIQFLARDVCFVSDFSRYNSCYNFYTILNKSSNWFLLVAYCDISQRAVDRVICLGHRSRSSKDIVNHY